MSIDLEQWRPINGFEGAYEVSSLGRVRSVQRWRYVTGARGSYTRIVRERVLKPLTGRGTYQTVWLYPMGEGEPVSRMIHVLVTEAFCGPRPSPHHVARHLNDAPQDNRSANLRWGTHKENGEDKERNGKSLKGMRNTQSKLTDDCVRKIRRMSGVGMPQRQIAAQFNVAQSQIWGVLSGTRWSHVA